MKRLTELKQRLGLALSILRGRDGNLVQHALTELQAAGYFDGDDMNASAAGHLIDLVRVFAAQGHTGVSAPAMVHLFREVANFKPLGPLTGANSEWFDHGEGMPSSRFQNRRASHVFKDTADGPAYDIDAVVFEEPSGSRFTGMHSRQFITFPYTPRSVVAQLPADATDVQRNMLAEQAWSAA